FALFIFGKRLPALILLLANLLYYLIILRKSARGYNDAIAKASILGGLCSPLKEASYTGRKGIAPQEFVDRSLLPADTAGNALLLRQGFCGEKDGDTYQGWECTFHFQKDATKNTGYEFHSGTLLTVDYYAAQAKGKAGKKLENGKITEEAVNGKMAEGEEPKRNGDALLLRQGLFSDAAVTPSLTAMGYEMSLEGSCILYQKKEAPLSEEEKEKALLLFDKEKTLASLRLEKTRALAFLEKRFYTVDVKPRDLPTIEQLRRNPLPERDSVWSFFKQWKKSNRYA
ncbi:MAG: hypothetical protein IIZ39_00100, partial [Blautia sp.]|nr:hypothetical protein [Blautia sp.]